MSGAVSLTLNEAGYVVGQSRTAINRAIDRGVIDVVVSRRGKTTIRRIGPAELRFLAIAGEVERDFTPAARRRIYEAIRRLPPGTTRLDLGIVELKLGALDRRIAERLGRLDAMKALVDASGDEPMLRGTAMPVHAVAALARGQDKAAIRADCPGLTDAQIDAATAYATVYPRTGRPLPARSLKRMLGDLAAAGAWDLEDDRDFAEPRRFP